MAGSVERSAKQKIYWRLLPFCLVHYLLAYVDRVDVRFAALTMRGDLHMSATSLGFASGVFFWGYFLFEVPSNPAMEKFGARLWIGRIATSRRIMAGATAFVTGPTSFAAVRFLPGVAEAGLFRRRRVPCFHRHAVADGLCGWHYMYTLCGLVWLSR